MLISDNKIVSNVEAVFCCRRTIHLHLLSTMIQWVEFLERTTTNTAATKDVVICSFMDPSLASHNTAYTSIQNGRPSHTLYLEMKLLCRFDSQILLGQQSFKQCSDVYNHFHLQLEKEGMSESM